MPNLTVSTSFVYLLLFIASAARAGDSLVSVDRGNGEGSAGAPPGVALYWYDSSIECPPGSAGTRFPGYRKVIYYDPKIDGEILEDACTMTSTPIPEHDPAYERTPGYIYGLVGYHEGIFHLGMKPGADFTPKTISAWCRAMDANDQTGLDVLVDRSALTGEYQAEILISVPTAFPPTFRHLWQVPNFKVERTGLAYHHPAFDLNISKTPDPAHPGQWLAQYQATIDGKHVEQTVRCRLTP